MKKKFLFGALALSLALTLTGCGDSNNGVQMNEDGTIKEYKEEDLIEGLYVRKGDSKSGYVFYPLLNVATNGDDSEGGNYQWYTSYDQLIPEMTETDTLVLYTSQAVPENFNFWKMHDQGYTVGIKFERNESGSLTFPYDQEGYCSYSPVYDVVKSSVFNNGEVDGNKAISIREVNGLEFKESLLTTDGFLKGLTKDSMYQFYYYQGTVYKSVVIKADTHVFIEESSLSTASYVELKDKTFEINLPSGIENGFWYIDGYGLIQYKGPETDLIDDSTTTENNDIQIEGDKDTSTN